MPATIALPVLWASIRLHLDKGKRWNAVEHLLLHAVCEQPRTAPELAAAAQVPRRLVIEVMIRLMRVGWVELVAGQDKSGFRATVAGHRVVRYDSLPAVTRPVARKATFAIEQISGAVFRARGELTIYTQARLDKVRQTTDVIVLPRETNFRRPQVDEVISALLDEDEHPKDVDPNAAKPQERYAIVRIDGEAINGLPARTPRVLRDRLKEAAKHAGTIQAPAPQPPTALAEHGSTDPIEIIFSRQDLIIGGVAHRVLIETALRRSRYRVVVHSTFIDAGRFADLLPLMKDAAAARRTSRHTLGKVARRGGQQLHSIGS